VRVVSFFQLAILTPVFWDQVVSSFWWCVLSMLFYNTFYENE